MKKVLLPVLTLLSFSFASNAITKMCVKSVDGVVTKYDIDKVAEVYYEPDFEFETEAILFDSVGIKLYNTPSMTKIPKPEGVVETKYFFEYWYESSDQSNDIDAVFEEYKKQATLLSSNKDMPIFWCESYGNKWSKYNGQQWNEDQKNFYFSLPNVTDPNGDVDEKGQVWAVVVTKHADNRIRVVVKMDCIKYNGTYYPYDNGNGTPSRN